MKVHALATEIADRCSDAYSADGYRSWSSVANVLLQHGLTELQTEAVMRSKWTRWAIDGWSSQPSFRYGNIPALAVKRFMAGVTKAEIEDLTYETFGEKE